MKFSFSQYQNLFLSPGPVCQTCGKVFMQLKNLNQHVHTIHEKSSTMFSCSQCDYFTCRKYDLKRHAKIHTPNLPPKISHHEPIPNIIDPPANDHLLEQLENQEIQSMLNQNNQVGVGVTQMTSADATLPDEIQRFLQMNNLGEQTEISAKSMSKIFLEFAIQKPSTNDPEFTLDT